MGRTKLLTITLAAAAFTASLFAGGCNRQEQALRARAEWPTSSPTAGAPGGSNAAHQTYDLQFIDWMTAHHQQAVQMAQLAVDKAQHAELKEMAQKMINDQQQEIQQMQAWRGQWFAGSPQTSGDHAGGQAYQSPRGHQADAGQHAAQAQATPVMTGSMQSDMSRLQAASGSDFDLIFLEVMIPHHHGAVQMSQNALGKAERQEVKQMAQKISEQQQQEITQMNQWLDSWRAPQGKSNR